VVYAGRSSKASMATATPSSAQGPATLFAYLIPSGCPDDIA